MIYTPHRWVRVLVNVLLVSVLVLTVLALVQVQTLSGCMRDLIVAVDRRSEFNEKITDEDARYTQEVEMLAGQGRNAELAGALVRYNKRKQELIDARDRIKFPELERCL